jgi:TetR/AcrR family transcriptional regulator, fatty acid metabolism regulator protein
MENTKTKILISAEELINDRGVDATAISEIANKAGVTTSLVHKYFGTKENLLFTFLTLRMEDSIEELREQLRGIQDPESRLRKLIWYSLRYNDNHPGYMRTLLFEGRSNRSFYTSAAHDAMKKHSRITMDILNKGAEAGLFRSDIDMRMIRDIIYGTYDFEAISCFVTGEIEKNADDFEEFVQILLRILLTKHQTNETQKEKIILKAAEKEISECGFHKAKISEIALRAKLAEGTIYEYFKSKEDLLFSLSIKPFQNNLSQLQEAFTMKSSTDKLRRLLKLHFELYLSNRDFLAVFVFDLLLKAKFYRSQTYEVFRKYIDFLEQVIEEGKAEGTFRQDLNARIFKNMFLGAFTHMAIRWVIFQQKQKFDKMLEIDNLVNLLSLTVANEGQASDQNK